MGCVGVEGLRTIFASLSCVTVLFSMPLDSLDKKTHQIFQLDCCCRADEALIFTTIFLASVFGLYWMACIPSEDKHDGAWAVFGNMLS